MVTKKIILILTICITIISVLTAYNMPVFAESSIININNNNNNVSNVDLNAFNNSTSTLYANGYRSLVSRYTNNKCHVKIFINKINIEYDFIRYGFSDSNTTLQFYRIINNDFRNVDFFNNPGDVNNPQIENIVTNGNKVTSYINGTNKIEIYMSWENYSIDFDIPLSQNYLTDSVSYPINTYLTHYLLDSMYYLPSDSNKYIKLNQIVLLSASSINYNVTYSLPYTLSNVDYVLLCDNISFSAYNGNVGDFYDKIVFNTNFSLKTNNITLTQANNSKNVNSFNVRYKMLDNSNLSSVQYQVVKTNSYVFSQSLNVSEQYGIQFNFNVAIPCFAINGTNYIASDSNNTDTPLRLTYFDCEWYEIHKQLANGVIFIITELPIVSNVTNAIYDMFTTITNAFNTLLNFSDFGLLFTFGMFVIVFAVLIKIIL